MIFTGKKMTQQEYREHPALSRSELILMDDCPLKFKYAMTNPIKPSESLIFGQLFHKIVLEPETFSEEFAVEPDIDKRTKDGKERYNQWQSGLNDNITVVSEKSYTKALDMARVVNNSRLAKALLDGERERAYFWVDEMTQVDCKCRLDCLKQLKDKLIIVDLKTTTSSNTEKWIRDSIKYCYDVQVAMYSEAVRMNYGVQPDFVFITIEKEPPYSINIFKADPKYYDYGYDHFRSLIGLYKHCVDTGNWYGYMGESEQINDLTLPSWLGGNDE